MIQVKIKERLNRIIKDLGFSYQDLSLSIPENPAFGDYNTNIALQLTKHISNKDYHSAREIASDIVDHFGSLDFLERLEVAGPGFINFFIKNASLARALIQPLKPKVDLGVLSGFRKRILIEYASPNANKPFHIGHLRNIVTGEFLSRILEEQGNEVFRVSYASDIGLPTAKTVWAVRQSAKQMAEARQSSLSDKAHFLGEMYVKASRAYEENPKAKEAIDHLNKEIYQHSQDSVGLWEETRQWSIAYLDSIYSRLGSEFDGLVFESEVYEVGKAVVEDNLGTIFEKDNGAIVFHGEKYGLHTRVFITSQGNPTYEAKEIGVTRREQELFPFDEAIHVVAKEQIDYFKVVIKVVELLEPAMLGRKQHIPYGLVTLSTGKMSSREGNIVTAEELIEQVKQEILAEYPQNQTVSSGQVLEKIALAAIKFSFLKYSINTDFVFDIKQSINLQGDSGSYLLYTYARTQSLLKMARQSKHEFNVQTQKISFEEREVLRELEYFELFVEHSAVNLQPNELCTYLISLARAFNLFYQKWPIIKSQEQSFRLALTQRVGEVLDRGLYLLGIESLERM